MQRVQRMTLLSWEALKVTVLPAVVGMLLAQIHVLGVLSPFAAAYCATLFKKNGTGLYAALGCAAGQLLSPLGASTVTAWCVAGMSVAYVAFKACGFRMKSKLIGALFYILLFVGILNSLASPYLFLIAIIEGTLAAVLRQVFLLSRQGIDCVIKKRPLTYPQILSLGVFACSVVMGTAGMTFMTLNTMHILIAAMCMLLSLCLSPAICGCFGIAMGCMAALCGGSSIQIVSNIGLCSLCAGFCAKLGKFGATMGFALANALFTFCFQTAAPSLHLGEAMIAMLLCALVPEHLIDTLCALLRHSSSSAETARARMASHAASQRIKAMATALEKTSRVMAVENVDRAAARAVQSQLDMAARELHHTANSVGKRTSFDAASEREIAHRLKLCGLEPIGVAVQKGQGDVHVRLEMEACGGRGLCNSTIRRTISKACGTSMTLQQQPCRRAKRQKCTLRYASAQPLIVKGGVATAKRQDSRVCGDVVSSCKLSGGRELFCLCDGMGSGQSARETAIMAVDLIESYFEAGYAQDQVLVAVNQLLLLRQSEVFAAADLLLIDTERMEAKFIKTCAGPSFLIRGNDITAIEMAALPIGVLDTVQPAVLERKIRPDDCIVLVSDGVADAMQGENLEQWFGRALDEPDESRAANAIVELAERKLGRTHDDMTAIVLRIVRAG